MKVFNSLIVAGKTKVQLQGEYGFRVVSSIHDSRLFIKVDGLGGSFQRKHVIAFTNKDNVEMYPAIEDLYCKDQYDSVYKRTERGNMFVGKLNGRSLKQFVSDLIE